jgi:hypothetical protein
MTLRHYGEHFMDGWNYVIGFRCKLSLKMLDGYTFSQFPSLSISST